MIASYLRISLAIYACIIVLGSVYADQCDSDHNTSILERAFGGVINTKLESQTAAITTMFNKQAESFDDKVDKLEEQFDDKLKELAARFDERIKEVKNVVDKLLQIELVQWTKVLDSLVWFSSEYATFDEAIQNCTEMGAKLFEPRSLRQNREVYAALKAKGRDQHAHWIGINDRLVENKFVYVTDNEPIAFEHWGSFSDFGAQPNNRNGNQDCVLFETSTASTWEGPDDAWNDMGCSGNFRFICEKLL